MKKLIALSFLMLALVLPAHATYVPSLTKTLTLTLPSTAVLTTGAPADLGSIVLPAGVTKYVITNIYIRAVSAVGTLAATTVDVRTAAGGAGSSALAAPVALTALTATDGIQNLGLAAMATQSAGTLYIRQTVASLSAGNIMCLVQFIDLSP